MSKRIIIWGIACLVVLSCGVMGYRCANKMCKEYWGKPLTFSLVKEHLDGMAQGAVLPKGNWSYGIDISHHQPIIRWNRLKIHVDENGRTVWRKAKAVRTESIDYVFMKATEGETFKDWRFRGRWKKAKRAGISRGAYHFFRPGKSALSQAQNFIGQVGKLDENDLPPVLDIEKMDECSVETLNERALEWLRIVEKHYGRKPIVYANPYYLNNVIDSRITQNYPVWVANYKVNRPSYGRWHYWQFSDRALVRGAGSVDLNVKPR